MRTLSRDVVLACLLEATAPKAGNVHPWASFADCSYADFAKSAFAIGPAFDGLPSKRVGEIVLDGVRRTREIVPINTNLGILLLLAPLAAVPEGIALRDGIADVLRGLTRDDAENVYQAIRLAQPGGLGRADREDVSNAPTVTLLEAMQLAAHRDRIADQYSTGFAAVFAGVDYLASIWRGEEGWQDAVVGLHLWLMSQFPDTLIARKLGTEVAMESARRARDVLNAGWPNSPAAQAEFARLDAWLRGEGNRRNPGTSADLVAACLFAALRERVIAAPPLPECARPFLPKGFAE